MTLKFKLMTKLLEQNRRYQRGHQVYFKDSYILSFIYSLADNPFQVLEKFLQMLLVVWL